MAAPLGQQDRPKIHANDLRGGVPPQPLTSGRHKWTPIFTIFFFQRGIGSKAAEMGIGIGFPTAPAPGSKLHSLLLKEWLKTCNESHYDHGCASNKEKQLPTRVLDVGDAQHPENLHLHITREGERGKYIALSHRWGNDPFLTTTVNNLNDLCKKIRFYRLPQTFQDAVVITRGLGIRYLWIDSLCVIQDGDNMSDWIKESRHMEEVFSSAYCTLAATSATGPTKGFLVPRPTTRSVRLSDVADIGLHVYVSAVNENFLKDVDEGALNKRAWVLQERALSCRIIHFTDGQTYWECGSVIHSDCLVQLVRPVSFARSIRQYAFAIILGNRSQNLLGSSNFPFLTRTCDPVLQNSFAFENAFATYSKLALTHLEDRPVAILGLVKRLEKYYKTKIIYGIVQCYLHKSLLWKRASLKRMLQTTQPCVPRVPSWSWMSLQGEICYNTCHLNGISWNQYLIVVVNHPVRLEASLRAFQDCSIEYCQDTNCKLRDAFHNLVGWIRFDREDEIDLADLRCIDIGERRHTQHGWALFGEEANAWKHYAEVDWHDDLVKGNYRYVLLVKRLFNGPEYQYSRVGVGVVLGWLLTTSLGIAWIV